LQLVRGGAIEWCVRESGFPQRRHSALVGRGGDPNLVPEIAQTVLKSAAAENGGTAKKNQSCQDQKTIGPEIFLNDFWREHRNAQAQHASGDREQQQMSSERPALFRSSLVRVHSIAYFSIAWSAYLVLSIVGFVLVSATTPITAVWLVSKVLHGAA